MVESRHTIECAENVIDFHVLFKRNWFCETEKKIFVISKTATRLKFSVAVFIRELFTRYWLASKAEKRNQYFCVLCKNIFFLFETLRLSWQYNKWQHSFRHEKHFSCDFLSFPLSREHKCALIARLPTLWILFHNSRLCSIIISETDDQRKWARLLKGIFIHELCERQLDVKAFENNINDYARWNIKLLVKFMLKQGNFLWSKYN